MALRLEDKWVWDFWLAREGADYHVFYLQAPRSIGEPELRHWYTSVGHAVSQDLRTWEVLPDALQRGLSGAWDDGGVWTGSVVRHEETWRMLYTGVNAAERDGGFINQRIGLATSEDLVGWRKHPGNPVLVPDPRYYSQRDVGPLGAERVWRDPGVFRHAETGDYHALITGRSTEDPPDGRGVIAHARSNDLVNWETLPPLTEPGHFWCMEVPQLTKLGDSYYLLFSTWAEAHSAVRRRETRLEPVGGTHYLVGESPLGPFHYTTHDFLLGDPLGKLYSGKLVEGPHGDPYFLAWHNFAPDGSFVGELADPVPAIVGEYGRLDLAT